MEYLEYVKIIKKVRKVLILGSGAVGKTSLTKVLKTEIPLKDMEGDCQYNRTLFVEIDQFKTKDEVNTIQVVDLAGQLNLPIHATRDTSRFAFNAVDLICFVFATDNAQSLIDLQEWVTIVRDYYKKKNLVTPPFILIRNKMDLENCIDDSLIELMKIDLKAYFELSCYNGKGVDKLKHWFNEFADECNAYEWTEALAMGTEFSDNLITQVKVKCKLCETELVFDTNDSATYLSKTEHQNFFGTLLFTYRVEHVVNGEKHLNAILVDQKSLFRGYIDAYKSPVVQIKPKTPQELSQYIILEEELDIMKTSEIFSNFIVFSLEGWILEVVKIPSIKMEAVLKSVFEKIQESKEIYEEIPQPLKITIADLGFLIWINGKTHLLVSLKESENIEEINYLLKEVTYFVENKGLIPKKRAFKILVTILQETNLVKTNPETILRLLNDDLFYSKIRTKYPDRIPTIIPKIVRRHELPYQVLEDLLLGRFSVIELMEEKPELVVQSKEIIETLDFINRRKLLD